MRRLVLLVLLALGWTGLARAQGMLMPTDTTIPGLSLVDHQVNVTIEDQVATTKVTQTFHNQTDRQLEATYLFPVPAGANVKKFTMWVDGKEVNGELVEADKARQIYTDIVRRTQDPGLLEYVGANLLRVRVFPVPAHGDQKIAICFTALADSDNGVVGYTYPLRHRCETGQMHPRIAMDVNLKSSQPIHNVYSPSHNVVVKQKNDREATIHYENMWGISSVEVQPRQVEDDFQLYYNTDAKDVGLTALFHRPEREGNGHFMLLLSPRAELAKTQTVPRDMVFVLDTSGSMQGKRIQQAKLALLHCLRGLQPQDRFALIHFASDVHKYKDKMTPASASQLELAERWVKALEPTGGTAINDALAAALAMRPGDAGRNFTVVFFTDGQPTVGVTNPDQILQNVEGHNTANTRIFTFGVGDDVNTVLLDRLAERTRSVSTYVRENEDIEDKVSKLYQKISKPVLTNLKLHVDDHITLTDVYPGQLPDLFHGNQLVILGRYRGKGETTIRLTGMVGKEEREFVYRVRFPGQTKTSRDFVEELWARRKVGYLLTQIRSNGDNRELVEEVVALAKKYGITTPYTSYLVAPDSATPVANRATQGQNVNRHLPPNFVAGLTPSGTFTPDLNVPIKNSSFDYNLPPAGVGGYPAPSGGAWPGTQWSLPNAPVPMPVTMTAPTYSNATAQPRPQTGYGQAARRSLDRFTEEEEEKEAHVINGLASSPSSKLTAAVPHSGAEAVDYAVCAQDLQRQSQVTATAVKRVAGRTFHFVGDCWVDEAFKTDMTVVTIKAQGAAYFDILSKHPEARDVFLLGNHVKWVTPGGDVLVIAPDTGRDEMSADEIEALFTRK